MKKGLTLLALVSALFLGNQANAQIGLERANKQYDRLEYSNAKKLYEDIVKRGYANANILKNTGNSYYFNGEYEAAFLWYDRLFTDFESKLIEPEYDYRYAQTLKNVGQDAKADVYFKKFASRNSESQRAKIIDSEKDQKKQNQKNSGRYTIEKLQINSPYSDYGTSIHDNKLLFASARDTGNFTKRVFTWTGDSFTKIYASEIKDDGSLGTPKKYGNSINTKYNESTPVVTKDGTMMYFTRNNYNNGRRGIDSEFNTLLKIYRAEFKNGKWRDVTELPFNSDQFSTAHPVLNAKENMLYFASDRPGGYGGSDIWRVEIQGQGFGTPENLGPAINTDGRETFPFVTSDDELYFSSDAREGFGGLDVYATKIKADGSFTKVQNIGAPVNGPSDDFAYMIDKKSKRGYFSSNRKGGVGKDDIYGFTENRSLVLECIQDLRVLVVDSKTRNILANANLSLFEMDYTAKATVSAMTNGKYVFKTDYDCGASYKIKVDVPNYLPKEEIVSVNEDTGITEVIIVVEAIKVEKPKFEKDDNLFVKLDLLPIYFDFDKDNIRPDAAVELDKIVEVMKENPKMKIDVRSFTDSRGSSAYNMKLSQRRAKSTAEWIISQGISSSRITYKGYGDTRLINHCTKGVKCTDEEQAVNRRSEFIVTEI